MLYDETNKIWSKASKKFVTEKLGNILQKKNYKINNLVWISKEFIQNIYLLKIKIVQTNLNNSNSDEANTTNKTFKNIKNEV